MVVVSIDIVNLLGESGIALFFHICLEVVDHSFVNNVPSRRVILNIGVDGAKHTCLLKEGEEVNLGAVTGKLHPIDLLLSIGVVVMGIVRIRANAFNHHGDDVGTFACEGSPKVQLPEGSEFYKMVIVTRSGGNVAQVVAVGIISPYGLLCRSRSVVVGAILQLP